MLVQRSGVPDSLSSGAILLLVVDKSVLQDCMLTGAGRMIDR